MPSIGQQAALPSLPAVKPAASAYSRTVALSPAEAEMLVRIVKGIVSFAKSYPLEFYGYCPMTRWQGVVEKIDAGIGQVAAQLDAKKNPVLADGDAIMSAMDLEECISGAKDARLSTGKWTLTLSAAGAAADTLFGISWLALPLYIISLALYLGRPIIERVKEVPAAPFKVDTGTGLSGKEDGYRVEYVGPRTGGNMRLAGPFQSRDNAVNFAMFDGGIIRPGSDGGYILYGVDGKVLEEGT